MVRVQGCVQAGAQLSARAGETVTAVMAPSSKAIRTGWQAMPSPLLRYFVAMHADPDFPRTRTAGFWIDTMNSPLLCPIQAVWRKNGEKRRQKTGLDFASAARCT